MESGSARISDPLLRGARTASPGLAPWREASLRRVHPGQARDDRAREAGKVRERGDSRSVVGRQKAAGADLEQAGPGKACRARQRDFEASQDRIRSCKAE